MLNWGTEEVLRVCAQAKERQADCVVCGGSDAAFLDGAHDVFLFRERTPRSSLLAPPSSHPDSLFSTQIGLIGSSTPFHSPSHAPFSLFYDDQLVSSGAVGVAIIDSAPSSPIKIDYSGLVAFSEPMEVTSFVSPSPSPPHRLS